MAGHRLIKQAFNTDVSPILPKPAAAKGAIDPQACTAPPAIVRRKRGKTVSGVASAGII
jgi:L-rhamnose isomerase